MAMIFGRVLVRDFEPRRALRSMFAAGPESLKALVAVADAVDYAYAVVGNQ